MIERSAGKTSNFGVPIWQSLQRAGEPSPGPRNRAERRRAEAIRRLAYRHLAKKIAFAIARSIVKLGHAIRAMHSLPPRRARRAFDALAR